jgi:hypothetical protein
MLQQHAMRICEGVEQYLYAFINLRSGLRWVDSLTLLQFLFAEKYFPVLDE